MKFNNTSILRVVLFLACAVSGSCQRLRTPAALDLLPTPTSDVSSRAGAPGEQAAQGLWLLDIDAATDGAPGGKNEWYEDNAGVGGWANQYLRTEALSEYQCIYVAKVPGDEGRWVLLADTARKLQGSALIRATLARLVATDKSLPLPASGKWKIREFPNETTVQNEIKFFELASACHRIRKRIGDAAFTELLMEKVAFVYGFEKGVLKSALGVVKTLLELSWEMHPVNWIQKGGRELAVMTLEYVGVDKADDLVPPSIDMQLKNAGIKGEDMLTVKNAVNTLRAIRKWMDTDLNDDPVGTINTAIWVKPLLEIVNAESAEHAGEETGAIAFDVFMVVVTVVDLGTTSPVAFAAKVGEGIKAMAQLAEMMFRAGRAAVISLGKGAWGKIKCLPYILRAGKGAEGVRPLQTARPGVASLREGEAAMRTVELAPVETATKSADELASALQDGHAVINVKPELPRTPEVAAEPVQLEKSPVQGNKKGARFRVRDETEAKKPTKAQLKYEKLPEDIDLQFAEQLAMRSHGVETGSKLDPAHPLDHFPHGKATPEDLAKARPDTTDPTVVYRSGREGYGDLRDWLKKNAREIDALAEGEDCSGVMQLSTPRQGVTGRWNGPRYKMTADNWTKVFGKVKRVNGRLVLVTFHGRLI